VLFVALALRVASGQADDPMSLADMEKLLIRATLRHTGRNITESAAILGIGLSAGPFPCHSGSKW
jgi:hypothetical protein